MEISNECCFCNLNGLPLYHMDGTNLREAFYAKFVEFTKQNTAIDLLEEMIANLEAFAEIPLNSSDGFMDSAAKALQNACSRIGNCMDSEHADIYGAIIIRTNYELDTVLSVELARIDSLCIESSLSESKIASMFFVTFN